MRVVLLAAIAAGLPVSPLAKDRKLFAPAVTPTAPAPRLASPEAKAAALAVQKSQDLAEHLREYKAVVERKKAEAAAPQKKRVGRKACAEASREGQARADGGACAGLEQAALGAPREGRAHVRPRRARAEQAGCT